MNTTTPRHTRHGLNLDGLTISASHWPDDNGAAVCSCITINTGRAHLQTNITAEQLDNLATMMHLAAESLRQAQAARESLATCPAE